jgi:hypothetical protein
MNIIDFSEAMILTIEATSKEGAESERLFIMAHKKFQEALSKISDDPIALYNWGILCIHRIDSNSIYQESVLLFREVKKMELFEQ